MSKSNLSKNLPVRQQLLGIPAVCEVENFFKEKKSITMAALEGELSASVTDYYVKGFF